MLATVVCSVLLPLACFGQIGAQLSAQGWRTDFDRSTIDLSELSVNVRRDAIPSIDRPKFVTIRGAEGWLKKREPVISVVVDGQARAYPLQILTWHEIVNDELAGVPLIVTFCPLCYSALVFQRTIEGDVYDFGVSGMLRHSDLVMYDRQTHSLFQQLNGEAIVGTLTERRLTPVAAQIISFEQFASAFPDGEILSRETGYSREYGRNPYPGYDDIDDKPWLFKGETDGRLRPMEKVVTVELGGVAKAYPHSVSKREKVINDVVGGIDLVVFHASKGALSALDKASISSSRNLGSTGVFRRELQGQLLIFEAKGNRFRDLKTRSLWDVTGLAVEGPLAGVRLEAIPHSDMFSFAWFVIHPESLVHE